MKRTRMKSINGVTPSDPMSVMLSKTAIAFTTAISNETQDMLMGLIGNVILVNPEYSATAVDTFLTLLGFKVENPDGILRFDVKLAEHLTGQ